MPESEFGYIKWIQKRLTYPADIIVGSGDDAAVVRLPRISAGCRSAPQKNRLLLATTDTIVENIDFVFQTSRHSSGLRLPYKGFATQINPINQLTKIVLATPEDVGHKAVAISLSDIAAMGQGQPPLYALLTVALPKRLNNVRFTHRLFNGMNRIARRFGVRIIGGDISSTSGPLVITSTLLGYSHNRVLTRSGAKASDIIMVTGKLGGSILGKHLSFTPRIREALVLNNRYKINSMIDISDGLAADLNHICEASNVGAILSETQIPVSTAAQKISRKSRTSPLFHALHDGEDFELLFTAPPDQARRILRDSKVTVSAIGFMTKGKGMYLENSQGYIRQIKPKGYTHF